MEGLGLARKLAQETATSGQLGADRLSTAKAAKERALQADANQEDKEQAIDSFQMLLAAQLVKEMRSTLPNGLFGGGSGADVYESWFDQHIATELAETDALGLAGMLKAAIGAKQAEMDAARAESEKDEESVSGTIDLAADVDIESEKIIEQ